MKSTKEPSFDQSAKNFCHQSGKLNRLDFIKFRPDIFRHFHSVSFRFSPICRENHVLLTNPLPTSLHFCLISFPIDISSRYNSTTYSACSDFSGQIIVPIWTGFLSAAIGRLRILIMGNCITTDRVRHQTLPPLNRSCIFEKHYYWWKNLC